MDASVRRCPMVAAIRLRALTAEEQARIDKLAHSRTAPARQVERARIIHHASQGRSAPKIAQLLGAEVETVRRWIHRFNAQGLAGLEDRRRAGRPATYPAEQVATLIATALTAPRSLGLPFAAWTLDRLAAYLQEHKDIAMKRSRIDEILLREGLRWRKYETWFGARVDPEFAEKGEDRGPLHGPARGQSRRLPRRDGARERQELSGSGAEPTCTEPCQAGDRLWPARQGLHLRRLRAGHARGLPRHLI